MQSPARFVLETANAVYDPTVEPGIAARVSLPMAVMSPGADVTIASEDELDEALGLLRQGTAALGVVSFRREILSVVHSDASIAVVSIRSRRFGRDDGAMGSHRSTFVVVVEDGAWRVRTVTVTDDDPESLVRQVLEDLFLNSFSGALRVEPRLEEDE